MPSLAPGSACFLLRSGPAAQGTRVPLLAAACSGTGQHPRLSGRDRLQQRHRQGVFRPQRARQVRLTRPPDPVPSPARPAAPVPFWLPLLLGRCPSHCIECTVAVCGWLAEASWPLPRSALLAASALPTPFPECSLRCRTLSGTPTKEQQDCCEWAAGVRQRCSGATGEQESMRLRGMIRSAVTDEAVAGWEELGLPAPGHFWLQHAGSRHATL